MNSRTSESMWPGRGRGQPARQKRLRSNWGEGCDNPGASRSSGRAAEAVRKWAEMSVLDW